MRLQLAKTLWGVDGATEPSKWDELFARIKAEGFQAVEAITIMWRADSKLFRSLLDKHGLGLICQIHTTGGDVDASGAYQYCTSSKLHLHLQSFVKLLTEAAALKPLFVNSHSGHDSWNKDTAVSFFKYALQMEAALGVSVVHETHRQRLLFSPYSTAEILESEALKGKLKINADLSHWCCVCEHVFDASDPRDDWWPKTLALVAEHCHFIHCRVGHAEGPQVNDPDAPEHRAAVDAHFGWWRTLWTEQLKRGGSGVAGTGDLWAEPEFGPPPYLQTLPFTNVPVADLWDVNKRVATRVHLEFSKAVDEMTAAEAAAASGATSDADAKPSEGPKKKWVKTFGGNNGGGYVLQDVEDQTAGGLSAAMLQLATSDSKEVARSEKAKKEAAAQQEQLRASVVDEARQWLQKSAELGAAEFVCIDIEAAAGDIGLLRVALGELNTHPTPLGKMLFSACADQLSIVAFVPADKAGSVAATEWTEHVLEVIGGKVMMSPPKRVADSSASGRGDVIQAAVAADAENGKDPYKDKLIGMNAAASFLNAPAGSSKDVA